MLKSLVEEQLKNHIKQTTYQEFQNILEYSVLPAGKLFRPLLGASLYKDLSKNNDAEKLLEDKNSNLTLLLCSLEIHHAYTLVHDDLPCMDNDDYRRGRESVHKKFGQWNAILAGDSLLHYSHALISKIEHKNARVLRDLFSWSLGAKGLILGQVYDLGGEIKKDFKSLMRTHELKTARLIQLALCGPALLSKTKYTYKDHIKYLRIGQSIGLLFQLLDDLSECTEELSPHEQDVSPFLRFPKESLALTSELINKLSIHLVDMPNSSLFIKSYLKLMKDKILPSIHNDESILLKNLNINFVKRDLLPVMNLL
jgi:geranylgeranyl pyrophosphate synthase